MSTITIVLLVILAVLLIAVVVLYFIGKKAQKKQAEQQAQIDAMKQTVSMLIIDKKRMKLKDAGLPQIVLDQTPKLLRGSRLKKEVKAVVSGIYITDVKGLHGRAPVVEQKKKSKFKQMVEKAQEKAGAKPVK